MTTDGGRSGYSGQSMVEFALLLPVFLTLVFGTLDFGRAVFSLNTITNAAREGARYGSILFPTNTDPTPSIQARVQAKASVLNLPSSNIAVTCYGASAPATAITCTTATVGDILKVRVTYTYQPFVIYITRITSASLPLTSTTQMAIQ